MSSSNRYSFDGNLDISTFDFSLRPDEPSVYNAHFAAQPLRYTKSNNAVPSFNQQPRQDTPMLRSRSDFDFTDSSTGVGADCFVQANSVPSFPGPRSIPSGFPGPGPLPINNYLTDRNSPWTGFETPRNSRTNSAFAEPNLNFGTYRNQPQSEIESNTTAQCRSDSGYASQPVASQSVKSGEYSSQSPEYPFYTDFENFDLSPMPEASISPPQEERPVKPMQRSRGGKRKCEKCNEILKCPSDLRKHMLKHDKPNKCDFQGCARVDGFSTINDLQRHQKSKHGIGLNSITTSFKCASPSCKNQEKIWPRRDNFKQHIIRMHKNEDVNELIARSEIKGGTSSNGASMEADLAGMSRYAEPQPPTVRPGELDMGNPETLETTNAAWLHPTTLSGGLPAHRSNALPARERNAQNFINYSNFNGLRGDNVSLQNLDALATVSAIHPAIDATRTVSSLGHGYASNISSSLASPDGQLVYNSIEAHQGLNDPSLREKLAIFENATVEERRKILEILGPDGLAGIDMEHDDGSSGSSPGPQVREKNKVCSKCGKRFEKKASLNKHMQRHTRPWACTHFACNKTFGAKDDWKRHERSQAPSAELWFCQIPDPDPTSSSGKCAIVEYDRQEFKAHLRDDHNLKTQAQIDNMALKCKIGYSHQWLNAYYQVNFWCGFCKKVIQADHDPHKQVGSGNTNGKGQDDNDPANHRWDHIDAHFKDGMTIESWVFWEANKVRGEIESLDDAKFVWDTYGKVNPKKAARKKLQPKPGTMGHKGRVSQSITGEKRKADGELPRPHERRPRVGRDTVVLDNWNCCKCYNGPISVKLHASCPGRENQCGHERCDFCDRNHANDAGEEDVLEMGPYDSWGRHRSPLTEKLMDDLESGGRREVANRLV